MNGVNFSFIEKMSFQFQEKNFEAHVNFPILIVPMIIANEWINF